MSELMRLRVGGRDYDVEVRPQGGGRFEVVVEGTLHVVEWDGGGGGGGGGGSAPPRRDERPPPASRRGPATAAGGHVLAPMPGQVVAIHVAPGQDVGANTALVTLESMKMESAVVAPVGGRVIRVAVAHQQKVSTGDLLVEIESP